MGLGTPRKRARISHDPNNTAWSRSSTKYGQKILESHGWAPGSFLGPKDAPHAKLHSAASASYIRIQIKGDNLGLGAKRGASHDDGKNTGLDDFQDLLGRLNGKTEQEVDEEQMIRSNTRRSVFVEQRWGRLRFVSGGFLVGDKLHDLPREQRSMAKRSMEDSDEEATNRSKTDQERSSRKQKERQCGRAQSVQDESNECNSAIPQSSRERISPQKSSMEGDCAAQDTDKTKRKAEKAERKLGRRFRKEATNKSKDEASRRSMALPLQGPTEVRPYPPLRQALTEHTAPKTTLPTRTTIAVAGGRNAARQHNIRHKRMAMLDSKALDEILMIKS